MKEEQIGMLVMAGVFALLGIIMMANRGFTAWGLRTRTGQKWVRLFGEDRSLTILRFVVSPLLIIMAVFFAWAVTTGQVK